MAAKVKVGTFFAEGAVDLAQLVPPISPGWLPLEHVQRCLDLLAGLDDVQLVHDLNIDRALIRDGRVWIGDRCLNELDVYAWFTQVDRSPNSFHVEALTALSHNTKVVVNPRSFAIALDKYRAHLALRRAGVRVADMVLLNTKNVEAARNVLAEWGRAVLKPRRGYFGRGVLLIDDFATLRDVAGFVDTQLAGAGDKTLLLERFYEHDRSGWISTTLIAGSLMYGYRKRESRWATFDGRAGKVFDAGGIGGEVDFCEVPPALADLARKAQSAVGAEIIGFDMLLQDDGAVIVDENTYPGLYPDLFQTAGKDLGYELFRMISDAIEECRERPVRRKGTPTAAA